MRRRQPVLIVLALLAVVLPTALAGSAAADPPTPAVTGYAAPGWHVSVWVPRVPVDDTCHYASYGLGDRPCFGYAELGLHLVGLPADSTGSARATVHWSESFACADVVTLAADPLPERRTTLQGTSSTEWTFLAGPAPWRSDARGHAAWAGPKLWLHSPNASWPDEVPLRCGPGESVHRTAVVLSGVTLQLTVDDAAGDESDLGEPLAVPGTYVAPWWAYTPGWQTGTCCP
jgi:hypothetical protein